MPDLKHIDSPNVKNYDYSYGNNGIIVKHNNSRFEANPLEMFHKNRRTNIEFYKNNRMFRILNQSALFKLDDNNWAYDIIDSY